jgi:hypothetical protein
MNHIAYATEPDGYRRIRTGRNIPHCEDGTTGEDVLEGLKRLLLF